MTIAKAGQTCIEAGRAADAVDGAQRPESASAEPARELVRIAFA